MSELQEFIQNNRIGYCQDCGKCSAVCPISHWETRAHTSPRLLIEKAIQGRTEAVMEDLLFWSCLTCKRCTEICPSAVKFPEFLRSLRNLARTYDRFGDCTHSEMIQTWGRMMTNPELVQNRLAWLTDDLELADDSDTILFTGCTPYYDPLFKKLGVEGVEIMQSAVKILNHLNIRPQILGDERCCGHDQLWEGDFETFSSLAKLNIERLTASGAKRIVTTCPECARTLRVDYPQFAGSHGLEVLHFSQLLADSNLTSLLPQNNLMTGKVTYQDPCRLGRYLGVYDAPRKLISDLGLELVEMDQNRENSMCCGTSCWRACGQVSKSIQVKRLEEAKSTGAETLVTACLKCQIHFKCAQNDLILGEKIDIHVRDLTSLVAERLNLQIKTEPGQEVSIDHR